MENLLALIGINENLIIVLIVFLLLFGGQKIPQLMRGLGRGMGEFQKGLEEGKKELSKLQNMKDQNTDHSVPSEINPDSRKQIENNDKDSI